MTTFDLTLLIDSAGLQKIRAANHHVVLARQIGMGKANVAWLAFDPIMKNSVSWSDSYGLYASQSPIQPGVRIVMLSSIPQAELGLAYSYANGLFSPTGSASPGMVTVQNSSHGNLTMGLTQSAVANGEPANLFPVNAAPAYPNQNVSFTPSDTTYVWIGAEIPDLLIDGPPTTATPVTFGSSVTNITLNYDVTTGRFVPHS